MLQSMMGRIEDLDIRLCIAIFSWNGRSFLDRFMRLLSRAGDGFLYPFLVAWVWIRHPEFSGTLIPSMAAAFALELGLQKALKHALRRKRPCLSLPEIRNLVALPDEFSFPSGHMAGAFLMALQLGTVWPSMILPFLGAAFLIGLSRVYNGVHYPTDVIAGALLGIASGGLGLMLF